jgi:hypothetical protein
MVSSLEVPQALSHLAKVQPLEWLLLGLLGLVVILLLALPVGSPLAQDTSRYTQFAPVARIDASAPHASQLGLIGEFSLQSR